MLLDEALRDHLLCGQRSEQTQKRLLEEPKLTLAKALQIAQAIEAANNHNKEISMKLPGVAPITEASVLNVGVDNCTITVGSFMMQRPAGSWRLSAKNVGR